MHHFHRQHALTPFRPTAFARAGTEMPGFWLQMVDVGLASAVFFAPLLMGGRHPLGQLILALLAVATAGAWATYLWRSGVLQWRPLGMPLWLLLGGVGLALLQITPLPGAVQHALSAHQTTLLPLWNSAAGRAIGLSDWPYLSMTPAETRMALTLLLSYGLLFVVVVQRVKAVEDVERLLRWCGMAVIGMAGFALVQFFAGNGKFFWFYQHPFTDTAQAVKGSFSNRNHFADFMALGLGPLIWGLQDAVRRSHDGHCRESATALRDWRTKAVLGLLGVGLAVVVLANMLSLSRGGFVAAGIACAVCTFVCYRASAVGGKVLVGLAAAGLLIAAVLGVWGYDRVANRVNDLLSGSLEKLDQGAGRREIWAATAQAIPDYLCTGAGVGSFAEVYPTYSNVGVVQQAEFTHSENCYLQSFLETGVPGFGLILAGIGCCAWWCWRGCASATPSRLRLCAGAIAASLAAFAAHSAVDFVWYVPACMTLVVVLAACALRLWQMGRPQPQATSMRRLPAWMPLPALVLLLVLGGWIAATGVGPAMAALAWDQYLLARSGARLEWPTPGQENMPPEEMAREQAMLAILENAVRWQPSHYRARLALAELHLRQFEALQATSPNPMSLLNVRDAVVQSHFPSRTAMAEWLERASGPHWHHLEKALTHAHRALAVCPLQGRAYIYLAQLSFLETGQAAATAECVAQALRVRPFDGVVLYAAGAEAYLAGDADQWLAYMKRACRAGPLFERRLLGSLIGQTAADGLPTMVPFVLREFAPELDGLRFLSSLCASRCRKEELTLVMRAYAEKARAEALAAQGTEAANLWLEAATAHGRLQEAEQALACAQAAVTSDPNGYQAHFALASWLLQNREFRAAETHLHWCLQRSPHDAAVAAKLKLALQGRLDAERRAAVGTDVRR